MFADLNLTLTGGDLVQVLGPNGSGKSTLLRVIIGLLPPESGKITWNNVDTTHAGGTEFHADSIYLGHKNAVAEDLTALENLEYFAQVRGISAVCSPHEALTTVGFSASPHRLAGRISAGQKQRLALAKLMLTTAKLWLLDEPFTALDSKAKTITETMLDQHCDSGGIAIIATHQHLSGNSVRRRELVLS